MLRMLRQRPNAKKDRTGGCGAPSAWADLPPARSPLAPRISATLPLARPSSPPSRCLDSPMFRYAFETPFCVAFLLLVFSSFFSPSTSSSFPRPPSRARAPHLQCLSHAVDTTQVSASSCCENAGRAIEISPLKAWDFLVPFSAGRATQRARYTEHVPVRVARRRGARTWTKVCDGTDLGGDSSAGSAPPPRRFACRVPPLARLQE